MRHSYISHYVHCIFSTKQKEYWITPSLEPKLYDFIFKTAEKHKARVLAVGGIENHIHILISLPTNLSVSQMIQFIKGGSGYWIHKNFPDLSHFFWQDGYSVFSIGISNLNATKKYIVNQKEHHKSISFEEEMKSILRKHGLDKE